MHLDVEKKTVSVQEIFIRKNLKLLNDQQWSICPRKSSKYDPQKNKTNQDIETVHLAELNFTQKNGHCELNKRAIYSIVAK